jgi:phenylacetate-CoA ligase
MSTLLDRLYSYSPVKIQNIGLCFYGVYWQWLRFGTGYNRFLSKYLIREKNSISDFEYFQLNKLKLLLYLSVQSVHYYHDNWSASQKKLALSGNLSDLPLLEKEHIRKNPRDFIRQDLKPIKTFTFHTSGMTGTPIASIWSIPEIRNSLALREARSARWAGVSFKMPRATFSGRMVVPDPNSKGPYYRFNLAERQVYFSAFHLKPSTASQYVQALWKHNIQWLTGYAVSYYILAQFILEQGLEVPPLKALITTSEKVTPEMRQVMQQAYQCRVYEEYSTVENALFASECEYGRLHVSPDAGIVEILRPDGSPCEPGEAGEVVATSFVRTYQPFIRYRLGDIAMWDTEPCPCGRQMPVIKEVIGRIEDMVIGPDGRKMVRFHGIFVDQPHIREGQIIQEAIDRIRVKIVPTDGFSDEDICDVQHRVQQRLGNSVYVTVEKVKEIQRTKSGKFRAVICQLSEQEKRKALQRSH